jgi:hypothetical protein
MVRMSKQGKRRAQYPKRRKAPSVKTGPLKDNLPEGYKPFANALEANSEKKYFIPKIK